MRYSDTRRVYIDYISKARKDNKVVKKGQPYIKVKRSVYSPEEYFKDEKDLDKVYPVYFTVNTKQLRSILKEFKEGDLSVDKYITKIKSLYL